VADFRFRITALAQATLSIDDRAIHYQRSMYRARVPLANLRHLALRRRTPGVLGLVTSELVLVTEPLPGVRRVLRWTIDPDSATGQAALAALRQTVGPARDLTGKPWTEAAAVLGVPRRSLRDAFQSRWGQVGAGALGAACALLVVDRVIVRGSPENQRIQMLVSLAAATLGVALLVYSYVRAGKD
jgi:hypothetical protein